MKNEGCSIVRIYVDDAKEELDLVDLARRQADHLGPSGIRAKRRQTNRRYLRRGYLRFKFRNRRDARRYIGRVAALHEPAIRWRLMRNRTPYL